MAIINGTSNTTQETINGTGGDDTIYGAILGTESTADNNVSGRDLINAGAGNDTVYAGDGNDNITGGDGDDEIHGGTGNDTAIYTADQDQEVIGLSHGPGGVILVETVNGDVDTLYGVENITFFTADGPVTLSPSASVVAFADTATTPEDTQIDIDVLANDFSITGGTLSIDPMSLSASSGSVSVVNGKIRFVPALNFNGTVTVNYEATNGSSSYPSTVTVEVTALNDAPTIAPETAAPTLVDTAANDTTFPAVTGQLDGADVDLPAQPLSYQIVGETPVSGDTVKAGLYGTLTVHSDGTYSYAGNAAAINALTAPTTDVFNVQVSDGLLSASTTLTVNITGANDAPTITAETAAPTLVDTAANDTTFAPVTGQIEGADLDTGASLSYQIVGETPVSGDTVKAGLYGTLTVHSDGSYSYAANAAAINALTGAATDVFNVEISDGSLSAQTTLTVNVAGTNDTPVAQNDTAPDVAIENSTLSVDAAHGVLANDTDVDNVSLTVTTTTVSTAQGGSITFQADGSYVYTPAANFSGTDSVVYTVSDGALTSTATLSIEVTQQSFGTLDSTAHDANGNIFVGAGNTAQNYNKSVNHDANIELGLKVHFRQGRRHSDDQHRCERHRALPRAGWHAGNRS